MELRLELELGKFVVEFRGGRGVADYGFAAGRRDFRFADVQNSRVGLGNSITSSCLGESITHYRAGHVRSR